MIGIQVQQGNSALAICRESTPEVIATGKGLADLVSRIPSHSDSDHNTVVLAVPSYYNDEQREALLQQARDAGIARPRLMNEPAAAALAFGVSQARMPETGLVLSLSKEGAFDVTLVAFQQGQLEVVAANGLASVDDAVVADSDTLFSVVEPVIRQVLRDGDQSAESVSAIILTGTTDPLRSISQQIESAFGQSPVEPPSPETAIARGAAVYCSVLDRSREVEKPKQSAAPKGGGCLSLVVLAIVGILLLAGAG